MAQSSRKASPPTLLQSEHVTKIKDTFEAIFKTLREMKQSMIVPPAPETVEDVREEEEINSDHELNQTGDNGLMTNKITNAAVKTVQNKVPEDSEWVPIGSGKTLIHKDHYRKVKWKSYTIATRTLLLAVFPRRVLATHSLTGKKSPAFQDKPAKMCLDPKIITDVIYEVMDRFKVKENLVRSIITTKCADECKMWKNRKQSKKRETKCNNAAAADAAAAVVDDAAAAADAAAVAADAAAAAADAATAAADAAAATAAESAATLAAATVLASLMYS